MFLESTQNQRCFNVEFYGWINVDKSTLNQRGYQVDRRHDVTSTYINVESTLSVCWVGIYLPRYLHIGIHTLRFARRKVEKFEIKSGKRKDKANWHLSESFSNV